MIWIGCLSSHANMSIESVANCLPELCTESETPTNSGDKGYRCETSNDVLIRCGRIAHLKKKNRKENAVILF